MFSCSWKSSPTYLIYINGELLLAFACSISAFISHDCKAGTTANTLTHLLKNLQCKDLYTLILRYALHVFSSSLTIPLQDNQDLADAGAG